MLVPVSNMPTQYHDSSLRLSLRLYLTHSLMSVLIAAELYQSTTVICKHTLVSVFIAAELY